MRQATQCTFASLEFSGAGDRLGMLPGFFGDLDAAWEQEMRFAADLLTYIERRAGHRVFVRYRVMQSEPQVAQALQPGHVAGLGEMRSQRVIAELLVVRWCDGVGARRDADKGERSARRPIGANALNGRRGQQGAPSAPPSVDHCPARPFGRRHQSAEEF